LPGADLKTVGVAGCGTMGAGIAIVAARAGFRTVLYDVSAETLERADRQIAGFLAKSVERGKLTQDAVDAARAAMVTTTDIGDLRACDVVIEAVFEDLRVKQDLLGVLDAVCPPGTIFASNTSTLSITEIAAGCSRPDRVVGLHFCLPAQLMKLVEVTPGLTTSAETLATAWQLCLDLGQDPVRTGDTPGFVLNYFVVPFNNDAIRLVEAGTAEPAEIDAAVKAGMGYKMGPCELLDLIGLDTQVRLCEAFHPVTNDPRHAAPPLLRRMVAAGHLGRKSGQGFYRYDGDAMFGGGDVTVDRVNDGASAAESGAERPFELVELGTECLGVHTGEDAGREGDHRVGFARFRLGRGEASVLVELVTQPGTDPAAVAAARAEFETQGLVVATCRDRAGRILDRLLRPYFNDALRALDNGLATAEDLDKTVRLGLGYPEGPIGLLHRTGLAAHHDVTKALFDATGERAFAPPRRAAVARARHQD
jgi:3-hydroxybutyryl-CoA dehydrogenase